MALIDSLVTIWREMGPVRWAGSEYGWLLEGGQPATLEPWQAAALAAWEDHREDVSTFAVSNVKKVGKTFATAVLTCWRWLALPGLHFVCANDLDQSSSRVFAEIADMVRRHPLLSANVRVTKDSMTFEPTFSELRALPVDAAGVAGANHLTVAHTEAWGIIHEGAVRAWEELTPPPGLRHGLPSLRVADSYSGWLAESETWHDLVDRGLQGERLPGAWPIWLTDDGLLLFHLQGESAQVRCFRGTAKERARYYASQRASLRPGAYSRMHLNERAAADDRFIEPDAWAALYDPTAIYGGERVWAGLDVGVKSDHCAVVSVYRRQDGRLAIGPHRIWHPAPVVDLDAVEEYIASLRLARLYADPSQAQLMLQRLRSKGKRCEEWPQTVGNMTLAGGALFDAVAQRRLVVGPGCEEVGEHVCNAVGRETARGVRLVKEKDARKIDGGVALAQAIVAANEDDHGPSLPWPPGAEDLVVESRWSVGSSHKAGGAGRWTVARQLSGRRRGGSRWSR